MKNKKFIWLVMGPTLIHLIVFIILPILGLFVISFFDYNPLRDANVFVGFENFMNIMKDSEFKLALKNTIVFVAVTVTLNIILSLVIAQMISKFKSNKIRSLFRMIFFLPAVAPMVASSVVFGRTIFPTTTGFANMILNFFGIASVNWLGDPNILMITVIIYTIWVDIGYNIILFSAGIDGIPTYVYEAADLDGASGWRKFTRITIPLLNRTFFFVTLQTIISHFQMFAQFSVLIYQDGPKNSGLVLSRYIYKYAFNYKNMGYASAISVVLFFIILIIAIIQQRKSKIDWEY